MRLFIAYNQLWIEYNGQIYNLFTHRRVKFTTQELFIREELRMNQELNIDTQIKIYQLEYNDWEFPAIYHIDGEDFAFDAIGRSYTKEEVGFLKNYKTVSLKEFVEQWMVINL